MSSFPIFLLERPHASHPPSFTRNSEDVIVAWNMFQTNDHQVFLLVSILFEMKRWFALVSILWTNKWTNKQTTEQKSPISFLPLPKKEIIIGNNKQKPQIFYKILNSLGHCPKARIYTHWNKLGILSVGHGQYVVSNSIALVCTIVNFVGSDSYPKAFISTLSSSMNPNIDLQSIWSPFPSHHLMTQSSALGQ